MADVVTLTMNPAIDLPTAVERVAPERKLRCEGLRRDPGGGGINVARVVRRMGTGISAIYTTGGISGRLLADLVQREGVDSIALMDLDRKGQHQAANIILNRYLWRSNAHLDLRGLRALPLFLGLRAGIRAMVWQGLLPG